MARGRRNTKQYICDTFIGGGLIDRWLGRLNEGQMRFASHPHLGEEADTAFTFAFQRSTSD